MNSLLLILLLGASVALAELPFDHPEFLNEEREEFLGEPADEENDSHRPRPSGTPVPIMVNFFVSHCFPYRPTLGP